MKFRFLLSCFFVCAALLPAAPCWGGSTVPLESWVYPAVEKLQGYGLVKSSLAGMRPWSRHEVARLVIEAERGLNRIDVPTHVSGQVLRLKNSFAVEIQDLRMVSRTTFVKPLQELSIDYIYQDAEPIPIADRRNGTGEPRIRARQTALNYNNYGIDYEDGSNLQLLATSSARFWEGRITLDWRPLIEVQDGGGSPTLHSLEAVAGLHLAAFELSLGRQSLWWGQGQHGSLILTNNAKPLDMVRLTNPSPVLLPWIFQHLGPFKVDFFLTRLEDDRVVSEPYLGGLRLNFKPTPWLELGASRTAMFGGEGRPSLEFSDILYIIGGENVSNRDEDTSNQLAAIDARVRLPFLWGAEVYGEWGGEDESDILGFIPFISNKSHLVGLYLPRIEPSGRLDLRLEFADLSHVDSNSPLWYRHGIYRSGYTNEGKIMGHHAGGGSEDYFARLGFALARDIDSSISVDYEKRGSDQPLDEKHLQFDFEVNWRIQENWSLGASVAFESTENEEYVPGNDRDNYLTVVGFNGIW